MQKSTPVVIKYKSVELSLNSVKLKVYETGIIFHKPDNKWIKVKVYTNSRGYDQCRIAGKQYVVHRIVYKAFNQQWDITDVSRSNYIDHIDHNRVNNRLSNLRVATQSENLCNTGARKTSRTGLKDISPWYNPANRHWYWAVHVSTKGICTRRVFRVDTGYPPDVLPDVPQHIIDERDKIIQKMHGEFACLD